MTVEIIRAEIENVKAVAKLFDEYRRWYHQEGDLEAAENFVRERIANRESVIFLAFIDGKPAGFTQLYPVFSSVQMGTAWLLNDLYIAEHARKRGIATAILDKAKQHGIDSGAKFLMLQTGTDNTGAQKLYEKNQWEKAGDFIYQLPLI